MGGPGAGSRGRRGRGGRGGERGGGRGGGGAETMYFSYHNPYNQDPTTIISLSSGQN